ALSTRSAPSDTSPLSLHDALPITYISSCTRSARFICCSSASLIKPPAISTTSCTLAEASTVYTPGSSTAPLISTATSSSTSALAIFSLLASSLEYKLSSSSCSCSTTQVQWLSLLTRTIAITMIKPIAAIFPFCLTWYLDLALASSWHSVIIGMESLFVRYLNKYKQARNDNLPDYFSAIITFR